jgi:PleD family two-component response regulator
MKTILIVDDDSDDRALFSEAITKVDPELNLQIGFNGLMALNKVKEEKPDLIFLDINMPVMDGWRCLSALKSTESTKDIPVIMYSTSSYIEDIDRAISMGALCFFTKPYGFNDLKTSIAMVISHLKNETLSKLQNSFIIHEAVMHLPA